MPVSRPQVSVVTYAPGTSFLDASLESLRSQSFEEWEWIVVLGPRVSWRPEFEDPRLRVIVDDSANSAAAGKHLACSLVLSNVIVLLESGNLLTKRALADILEAFAQSDVEFVYSDGARLSSYDVHLLSGGGARQDAILSQATEASRAAEVITALDSFPHVISSPWLAPRHGRAVRRRVYERAGGYDATAGTLADEDLLSRVYLQTGFRHLTACLEFERPPETISPRVDAAARHQAELGVYDRYVQPNALAWAARNRLMALDLSPGEPAPGFVGLPQTGGASALVDAFTTGFDLPDSSVGVIRMVDSLSLLPEKVAVFNELHRVLAHGGLLLSLTPSSDGRGAFQDPRAQAYYNENSFWYFTEDEYLRYVPVITARFLTSRLVTYFPTEWHERNLVSYVCANLVALKNPAGDDGTTK